MEQVKFIPLLIICVQTTEGFIWNSTTTSSSVCVGNTTSLDWVYTLKPNETLQVTVWKKSDGAGASIRLANDLVGFTPAEGYVGRLKRIGNAGIQISNATSSDTGTYTVIVILTSGSEHIMDAAVHVHVNFQQLPQFVLYFITANGGESQLPVENLNSKGGLHLKIANASCIPTCDNSLNCQIPQACPVKKYIDAVKYPDGFQCSRDNNNKPYSVCAKGDAVTSCYSGPSLCLNDTCKNVTHLHELGFGLGFGLGFPCVITICVFVVFICTGYKDAHYLGVLLGMFLINIFQIGTIGFILGTTSTTFELGLGFGLGSGILCLITGIIAVMFVYSSFSLFKGIPSRVDFGKGILIGLGFAFFISTFVCLIYFTIKKGCVGFTIKQGWVDVTLDEEFTSAGNKTEGVRLYRLGSIITLEPKCREPDNKPQEPAGREPDNKPQEPADKEVCVELIEQEN